MESFWGQHMTSRRGRNMGPRNSVRNFFETPCIVKLSGLVNQNPTQNVLEKIGKKYFQSQKGKSSTTSLYCYLQLFGTNSFWLFFAKKNITFVFESFSDIQLLFVCCWKHWHFVGGGGRVWVLSFDYPLTQPCPNLAGCFQRISTVFLTVFPLYFHCIISCELILTHPCPLILRILATARAR